MKTTKKWRGMAEIYRRFARDWAWADFSDEAAFAMFCLESHGTPLPEGRLENGFALGKKWMDVTIEMWHEDIGLGLLRSSELLADGFPEWFLKRIGILKLKSAENFLKKAAAMRKPEPTP